MLVQCCGKAFAAELNGLVQGRRLREKYTGARRKRRHREERHRKQATRERCPPHPRVTVGFQVSQFLQDPRLQANETVEEGEV